MIIHGIKVSSETPITNFDWSQFKGETKSLEFMYIRVRESGIRDDQMFVQWKTEAWLNHGVFWGAWYKYDPNVSPIEQAQAIIDIMPNVDVDFKRGQLPLRIYGSYHPAFAEHLVNAGFKKIDFYDSDDRVYVMDDVMPNRLYMNDDWEMFNKAEDTDTEDSDTNMDSPLSDSEKILLVNLIIKLLRN